MQRFGRHRRPFCGRSIVMPMDMLPAAIAALFSAVLMSAAVMVAFHADNVTCRVAGGAAMRLERVRGDGDCFYVSVITALGGRAESLLGCNDAAGLRRRVAGALTADDTILREYFYVLNSILPDARITSRRRQEMAKNTDVSGFRKGFVEGILSGEYAEQPEKEAVAELILRPLGVDLEVISGGRCPSDADLDLVRRRGFAEAIFLSHSGLHYDAWVSSDGGPVDVRFLTAT